MIVKNSTTMMFNKINLINESNYKKYIQNASKPIFDMIDKYDLKIYQRFGEIQAMNRWIDFFC